MFGSRKVSNGSDSVTLQDLIRRTVELEASFKSLRLELAETQDKVFHWMKRAQKRNAVEETEVQVREPRTEGSIPRGVAVRRFRGIPSGSPDDGGRSG